MTDRNLLSPCGLYCGVCGIRTAYLSGNPKFIDAMAKTYGVRSDEIKCDGCFSSEPFVYCRMCPIKSCILEKQLDGCHLCDEWPCERVESFPFAPAKSEMKRAIPVWRELGDDAWAEHEAKWFSCRSCGAELFRGASRCRTCGQDWQPPE